MVRLAHWIDRGGDWRRSSCEPEPSGLSTDECRAVIAGLGSIKPALLILTGGEPMARPDMYDLAAQAHAAGMRVVAAPCGHLVTPDSAARLISSRY